MSITDDLKQAYLKKQAIEQQMLEDLEEELVRRRDLKKRQRKLEDLAYKRLTNAAESGTISPYKLCQSVAKLADSNFKHCKVMLDIHDRLSGIALASDKGETAEENQAQTNIIDLKFNRDVAKIAERMLLTHLGNRPMQSSGVPDIENTGA